MDVDNNLILLIEQKFKKTNGYSGWDRVIQRIDVNEDEISLMLYRSNQSSIHYTYMIKMLVRINRDKVSVVVKRETSTSRGDPYCGRGYNKNENSSDVNKYRNDFKTDEEIVEFIDRLFWKHYFKINSRN